mmetsp:Transcript_54569/g.152234  ORF Transcript_54569/g.152234 Transcript_54569/m.152234 type:complete len:286 (+) Transcript_54569:1133-1990(+)
MEQCPHPRILLALERVLIKRLRSEVSFWSSRGPCAAVSIGMEARHPPGCIVDPSALRPALLPQATFPGLVDAVEPIKRRLLLLRRHALDEPGRVELLAALLLESLELRALFLSIEQAPRAVVVEVFVTLARLPVWGRIVPLWLLLCKLRLSYHSGLFHALVVQLPPGLVLINVFFVPALVFLLRDAEEWLVLCGCLLRTSSFETLHGQLVKLLELRVAFFLCDAATRRTKVLLQLVLESPVPLLPPLSRPQRPGIHVLVIEPLDPILPASRRRATRSWNHTHITC